MSLDRSRRAFELFDVACDLAESERASYLSAECGQDGQLRREVESLLRNDGPGVAEDLGIRAIIELGTALARLGRFDEARALLISSYESAPAGGAARRRLAETLGGVYETWQREAPDVDRTEEIRQWQERAR